jgi:hypothetical protein
MLTNNNKPMKKLPLNKGIKAEHKPAESVLMKTDAAKLVAQDAQNDCIKEQFAQQERIYQRMKNPVIAMVCCLIIQA